MSNLLARYDELLAVKLSQPKRSKAMLEQQQQVLLAIDGLQPDMGHEVLWVIRDCLSGEILLVQTLLSATTKDLAALLLQVKQRLSVPIVGVISDGQQSIRKAVAQALPEVAHGLCHFPYLREAAKLIYQADRHAKKELKKRVRGVRELERSVTDTDDAINEVVQGYCQAVRAALTDDGRPPLDASGLQLHQRLSATRAKFRTGGEKGELPKPLIKLKRLVASGLEQTAALWHPIRIAFAWVHQAASILKNEAKLTGLGVRCRLRGLLGAMARWKSQAGEMSCGIEQFLKVTRSYWSGLFYCYDIAGLPRTNNDLEQVFGKWRHHQRRCTGRKVISATAVVRGSVQLVAALATQQRSYSARELATGSRCEWQQIRTQLQEHQQKRVHQRQFRRSPANYLTSLEQKLLQLVLPP